MWCLVVLILVPLTLSRAHTGDTGPCKSWEFRCGNDRCISPNRYCDGTYDCGDASDEPTGCSNCNQTLMGEVGTKFPLRITEPFQRNLPFICKLHLVAGGGTTLGETLEITFLSFQIGSLTLDRNGTEDRLECRKGFLRLSESHEDIFLGDDGARMSGSTLRSQQTRGFSQLISAFKEPPTHKLSTLYDLTASMEPDFGLFCGNLISSNLGVAFYSTGNNVTLSVYLPPRSSVGTPSMMGSFGLYLTYRFLSPIMQKSSSSSEPEQNAHLGNPVANTYCDRTFVNCDRKKCLIRSPNFPGLYLRNFTCNFFIRQDHVPNGKRAHIVVYQPNEYKISVNTGSSMKRSDPRKPMNQGNKRSMRSSGLTTDCAGDVVRIYDRINSESKEGRLLLTAFCESGSLTDVVSSGPEMLVQLHSAPSNLLYESRLELDIRVEFSDTQNTSGVFTFNENSNCEISIDGSTTRSGVIQSPRHSVPRNTTCTARLRGSSTQRIWLYFVSYFVQDHDTLGFDHHPSSTEFHHNPMYDDTCDISSLDLFLDVPKNVSVHKLDLLRVYSSNYTLKFCEKTIPVMCTRAADYEHFIPKKPCMPSSESYLSVGSEVILRYSIFMQASDVVSSLSATSFVIRYEFVDVEQEAKLDKPDIFELKACIHNISSNSSITGSISSPKNLFFYGRGGRETLLCEYNFRLKPKERLAIEVLDFKSRVRTCSTYFNPLLRRYTCRFNGDISTQALLPYLTAPYRHSFLTFTEYSSSTSVFVGCVCDNSVTYLPKLAFTSSAFEQAASVTMSFHVSGMTPFEDFQDYMFNIRYHILKPSTNEKECRVVPDTLEKNRTHGGELTFQAFPAKNDLKENILRCQWFLQSSSPDTYLYLQLQGRKCDNRQELDELNRVILYSSGHNGLMYPKTVLCLSSPSSPVARTGYDIFDFFSSSWHNNDSTNAPLIFKEDISQSIFNSDKNQSSTEIVIVELMALKQGTLTIKWLEVTRLSSKPENGDLHSDEGRTLKNVNCLFECPELSACINPELWCDGIMHCPHSGFDESSDNCQQSLTLYLSIGFGCLAFCVGVGLVVFFLFRRYAVHRHMQQQTHPATYDHHPHCLQHNQNLEFTSKHFQDTSPVFMVGGSMTKKKKKSHKDDYIRHLQTVEVRFPDIHM